LLRLSQSPRLRGMQVGAIDTSIDL
jgi:hypothetical protein